MPFDVEGGKYREKLENLKLNKANNDITLVADDEQHKAHRAVLQLTIPYFKALFATECKETGENVLNLPVVSSEGLKAIIEYAYSGKIDVKVENVHDVLISADYLQCKNVVEVCKKFVVDSISVNNCLSYYELVALYAEELQEFVKEFILWNFTDISQTAEFLDVSEMRLIEFLGATELHSQDEFKLYTAAQKWLNHNNANDDTFTAVMKCIRFPLIPLEKLKDIEKDERLVKNDELKASLMEAIEYRSEDKQIAVLPIPCKLRGEMALIQVNRERGELTAFPLPGKRLPSDYVYNAEIKQFSENDAAGEKCDAKPPNRIDGATNKKPDDNNNESLTENDAPDLIYSSEEDNDESLYKDEIPDPDSSTEGEEDEEEEEDALDGKLISILPDGYNNNGYHTVKRVMSLNNFLYVAALKAKDRETDNDCDVLRYEVATNTWMKLFNIWYLPDETVTVATDKYLVFIAHHPRQEMEVYDDVPSSYRYSIADDKFNVAKHYPIPYCEISEHQGCALGGLVYLCGGKITRNCKESSVSKAFSYDPNKNEYKTLSRMNQAREEHLVATDGKLIFAIGGQDASADYTNLNPFKVFNPLDSDSETESSSVSAKPECYNPETNQWTFLDWKLSSFQHKYLSVLFVSPDFITFEDDESYENAFFDNHQSPKYTRMCRISLKTGQYDDGALKKLPPLLPMKIVHAPPRSGSALDYPGHCRYVIMQI